MAELVVHCAGVAGAPVLFTVRPLAGLERRRFPACAHFRSTTERGSSCRSQAGVRGQRVAVGKWCAGYAATGEIRRTCRLRGRVGVASATPVFVNPVPGTKPTAKGQRLMTNGQWPFEISSIFFRKQPFPVLFCHCRVVSCMYETKSSRPTNNRRIGTATDRTGIDSCPGSSPSAHVAA